MRERFWERVPLAQLTRPEWEALCDSCGKCCLNKLEDEETGQVALTRVACRLFDDSSCRCLKYSTRHDFVPECIVLTHDTIDQHMYWLPDSCAYRRLHEGRALPHWHYLVSGDPQAVHAAGASAQDITVSEAALPDDDWEDYIIEDF